MLCRLHGVLKVWSIAQYVRDGSTIDIGEVAEETSAVGVVALKFTLEETPTEDGAGLYRSLEKGIETFLVGFFVPGVEIVQDRGDYY